MMNIKKNLLMAMMLAGIVNMSWAEQSIATQKARQHPLVYSHDEMFQFDIENYLQARAPHLLPFAETISHWSGYTTVSPKVLIALMEQQSAVISKAPSNGLAASALNKPFGDLSRAVGFAEQVRDVADQLANIMYAPEKSAAAAEFAPNNPASPLQALFAKSASANLQSTQGLNDFAQTYARLFGKSFDVQAINQAPSLVANANQETTLLAGPANGFLQFPFPTGATWYVGGAHTTTGSGNYPLSSLDMSLGGGWGSNQNNVWVSSSAAGAFKKHSSCFAEIVHAGGWSTTYYHLMNIQYNTGASVNKNVRIANPAHTKGQALCNGGHSTGPHEHWSLKLNGAYYHLNGVSLSGWYITATGSSYDTNCSRFYFTKNGSKKCAGSIKN